MERQEQVELWANPLNGPRKWSMPTTPVWRRKTGYQMPIKLSVRGLGNVPSFKNSKMIARGRLITNPKKQEWMERCTKALASQLLSVFQTTEGATSTDALRQFLIAWCPQDDCWQVIPAVTLRVEQVKKGEEGFELTIETL